MRVLSLSLFQALSTLYLSTLNGNCIALAIDLAYLMDRDDLGAFGKPSPAHVSVGPLLPVDAAVAATCSN